MTNEQHLIHKRAIELASAHRRVESELIKVLQQVDRSKLFKRLNCPSLFIYATEILGLTESVAYALIAVARKCLEVPELNRVIEAKDLSPFKAVRIAGVITSENADSLIAFAQSHTSKEIDFEAAKYRPDVSKRSRAKVVAADKVELKVTVSKDVYEKLQRVQSLLAQKQKDAKLEDAVEAGIENFLFHHDPVVKAERAAKKKAKQAKKAIAEPCSSKVPENAFSYKRQPLTAEQKHAVFLRDGGKCTHTDIKNHRCNSDRWIDVHHVIPLSMGGTNDPGNLTTLCSFHHDLAHQLSFGIEGQVTWLRSPRVAYG